MEQKTAYLQDGTKVNVVDELPDGRFIVNKYYEVYYNYEVEDKTYTEEEVGKEAVVVDKVYFGKAPTEKIDKQIVELQKKISSLITEIGNLRKEKSELETTVKSIQKTQIDENKFIINRSELLKAKSLVMFRKDRIEPMVRHAEEKSMRGLKLNLNIELVDGSERAWGYSIYEDYTSSSDYLCPKYGYLIDPTEEEIMDVVKKRNEIYQFSDWTISVTPDKYLNEEQLKIKNSQILLKKQTDIEKYEEVIKQHKLNIEKNLEYINNLKNNN
jgi:hypothetical protein